MQYTLRNFSNSFQIVNSTGWIFILLSIILIVIKGSFGFLMLALLGAGMIWAQLRGKRVKVDTENRTVRSSGKVYALRNPEKIFMNKIRVSQNVNSRAQSANVKTYFYLAYLQDGDEKILLSSNRKEERDLDALKSIASDLDVDFVLNY